MILPTVANLYDISTSESDITSNSAVLEFTRQPCVPDSLTTSVKVESQDGDGVFKCYDLEKADKSTVSITGLEPKTEYFLHLTFHSGLCSYPNTREVGWTVELKLTTTDTGIYIYVIDWNE